MVIAKVQAEALFYDLIASHGKCHAVVIYAFGAIIFFGQTKSQNSSPARFEVECHFTATRTGSDGRAERIKETGRGAGEPCMYNCFMKGQRLLEIQTESISIVCVISVVGSGVYAAVNFALTGGPGKTQQTMARQTLLQIQTAYQEIRRRFLSLQYGRKTQLQSQTGKCLSTSGCIDAGVHAVGSMFVSNDDLF